MHAMNNIKNTSIRI